MTADTDRIVFVTEDGTPTGETGPKLASHTATTRLHLAFSCYIFRKSDSAFLVTKRDSGKKVWPGVWTNSVCGHPAPGETIEEAIKRRAAFEVGIANLTDIACVLPQYRYTTPPSNGIIENEFCPVYVAYTPDEPQPNPDEVEDYAWMTWPEYIAFMQTHPETMSYWAKDQYLQLKDAQPFAALTRHG